MESKALVSYLEKIRYGRNISQEDMIHGIISIRQYRRYLYGEVEIPFGVIGQLASKMGIPSSKLLAEFEEEKNKERRLILAYYNAVVVLDNELVDKYYSQIKPNEIVDKEQKMLYESASIIHKYHIEEVTKEEMIQMQKKIIDYPKIMDNKILTDAELTILAKILDGSNEDHNDIFKRFEMIFSKDEFHISGDNAATMIQIVFWLAKYYGRHKEYRKTIEFCNYGIESNKRLRTIYLMEFFNYYNALAHLRTNNISKYKEYLYEAILHLEIIPDKARVKRFHSIIKKDLDIEPLEFVHEYLGEKLKK